MATRLGTTFLFVLFVLLDRGAGTLDFDQMVDLGFRKDGLATLAFVLAIVGFGTKAGFVPFHVWLPEAYSAAPSHVSAVMSGVILRPASTVC